MNLLVVEICVTNDCTYLCRQCRIKKYKNVKYLNLQQLYIFIQYLLHRNISLTLVFNGDGEPTLHNDLFNLCKKLERYSQIQQILFTNGSKNLNILLNYLNIKNLKMFISYHIPIGDKYYNIELYQKCKKLNKNILNLELVTVHEFIYKKIQKNINIPITLLKVHKDSTKAYDNSKLNIIPVNNMYINQCGNIIKYTEIDYLNGIQTIFDIS